VTLTVLLTETGGDIPPDPLIDAFTKLYQGLSLLGDAITMLLTYLLASLGIEIPPIAIRIATIIMVILTLYKLGNVVSKLVLYAMIFLLISMFAGLIPAVGDFLSGSLG
jgi:hypothetical protein